MSGISENRWILGPRFREDDKEGISKNLDQPHAPIKNVIARELCDRRNPGAGQYRHAARVDVLGDKTY